ncbi:protein-disulfide reductase DsbD domain-containing protein [Sinisalibacter aestuarii]|uniref:Thiol:disulfide interchange protein DsbD N-terminal domain-containing protein n=1 Tax=Sinisalibacter aestuarii TaxID=2949426 RepID=A0ABQ5LPF7_9RHOB|nr:protein-disulfide reductase DsbD domain-containing protein [Sinisalibacter aestuarii]GKY86290.1 hypothetical protein STA1M1_01590 [Sinisalibacter aestuarii]
MFRFAATLSAALLAAAPLIAGDAPATPAKVELLPGWRSGGGTHMAALRITLDDGWKTYWRAPGEAGLPPQFDWSGSENLADLRLHWPVPDVFTTNGMTTLGYHHELVLPVEVVPADPAADVVLDGALTMGICQDICMPFQTDVSATLPRDQGEPDMRIAFALDRRPDTEAEAGLVSARCSVEPIADGLRVTAKIDLPPVGPREMTVVETPDPAIWVSEAVTRRAENMLTATADLVPPDTRPFDLDTQALRFTVLSQGRAVDIRGCAPLR